MYTDPTGYFSLAESSVVQGIQGVLNNVLAPMFNIKRMMSWANMALTMYDIAQQFNMLMSGEATVEGLAKAIAKGMITQALLNCALTKVLGKAANTVVKLIGIAQDTGSFIEAVKSGDPERIMVESLRLVVSLYTLKCECFTGETLVSTTEGDKRIDEIKIGDYVYAYDTEKEENVPAKVTYVSITETDILVHVYTSEGEEIKTTMFHPFYVKNVKNGEDETYGIWKASANLVAGDELLTEDGRVVYVEEVRIERLAESVKVYNLEVEGLHTYYVGSGVLVHNDYAKGNSSSESGSKTGKLTIIDGGDYSTSEINAAQYMADLGNDVVLRPPVGTRADGGTSDLLVNGVNYDVYTPTTSNPSAIIRAITKKNTQTTGVVLDLSSTTVTTDDLGNILARVKGAIEKNGGTCNINDIVVMPK